MAIRMIEDVGAPLAVTVVNSVSRTAMPQWHDWIVYLMTAGGYVAAQMKWGGDFAKNIGVSSAPLSFDKLYERIRGGTVSRKMAYRGSVSRYPAPAFEKEFQGVRLD